MPPVLAASLAWAKIVLLSGTAAKFILMPVFAVKLMKICFRSKPDQPMKLSSPDVAKASRTIRGAAIAAAPALRTIRRLVLGMVSVAEGRASRARSGNDITEARATLEAARPTR